MWVLKKGARMWSAEVQVVLIYGEGGDCAILANDDLEDGRQYGSLHFLWLNTLLA